MSGSQVLGFLILRLTALLGREIILMYNADTSLQWKAFIRISAVVYVLISFQVYLSLEILLPILLPLLMLRILVLSVLKRQV